MSFSIVFDQEKPIAATQRSPALRGNMSFRLWTIFYVFALLAAAMATFGTAGIIVAMCVAGLWFVFIRGSAKLLATIAIVALVCLVVVALLLPAISIARPAAYRNLCANHLKQIAIALQNYHDVKGMYPPSYISDSNGAPILSWRVPILPYMEEAVIYRRFDISKAWNAPTNRSTTSIPINAFQCPSHSSSAPTTHYLAIVGPQTAWPESRGRSLDEITDGPANTILLI